MDMLLGFSAQSRGLFFQPGHPVIRIQNPQAPPQFVESAGMPIPLFAIEPARDLAAAPLGDQMPIAGRTTGPADYASSLRSPWRAAPGDRGRQQFAKLRVVPGRATQPRNAMARSSASICPNASCCHCGGLERSTAVFRIMPSAPSTVREQQGLRTMYLRGLAGRSGERSGSDADS